MSTEKNHRLNEVETDEEPFVPTGRLKGAEHLIGCFEGPEDLSTNPAYMEDAREFMRSHRNAFRELAK